MRWAIRALSSFDPEALAARFAAIPAAHRLYSPQRATPIRMAAELLLRELLTEQTGAAYCDFRFLRTPRGKPYAENAPHFNLSHSGRWILCAVDDAPVGVDIETPRPVSPALMRRTCTPAELAEIDGRPERFLQTWTAKEAYLKYRGTGIDVDLRRVDTARGDASVLQGLSCLQDAAQDYVYTIVYETPR